MIIDGYTLLERIGAGAAGEVWRARRETDHQVVAIKIMHNNLLQHPIMRERLKREAETARLLEHPNIVKVIDVQITSGAAYIVMEYLPAQSLESVITRSGVMAKGEVIRIGIQVLKALEYLHEHQIVHRDIKADNVLIDARQQAWLTDLGLVRHLNEEQRLTNIGTPLGTPGYMPPEQWEGRAVDHRADLFAVGVMLYYMLSGKLPFPGNTAIATFHRLHSGAPDPITLLQREDSALYHIIMKALAKKPEDRFQSAADFIVALNKRLQHSNDLLPGPNHTTLKSTHMNPSAPVIAQTTTDHDAKKLAALPVEFAKNCWWVGKRPPGEIFYANPYLRVSEGNGQKFHLLIDPGSSRDVGVVQAKCSRVLRNELQDIGAIFVNHQDPDVGSSIGVLLGKTIPGAHVMCSEDTWRLIQYYNVPRERFIALEKFPNGFDLPTGETLVPVPSPFCHFVGAIMLYDPVSRVLFSGDLFGGLTARDAQGLWADESDWVGMRAFHQIYMPTNRALKLAINTIRNIKGGVDIIAPQHGRLIRGPYVKMFMERLENLPVGLDILSDRQATPEELRAWNTVLKRVMNTAKDLCDKDLVATVAADATLREIVTLHGEQLEVKSLGKFAVERVLRILDTAIGDPDLMSALKYEVVFATEELGLPTPSMELDEDSGPSSTHSMLAMI
jgi:serine/threonine-protein kinase